MFRRYSCVCVKRKHGTVLTFTIQQLINHFGWLFVQNYLMHKLPDYEPVGIEIFWNLLF